MGALHPTPHPNTGPEVMEDKGPNKMFWPKLTGAEGTKENFDWPKAQSKIWPNHLGLGGGSEGAGWEVWNNPPPPPSPPLLVLSC